VGYFGASKSVADTQQEDDESAKKPAAKPVSSPTKAAASKSPAKKSPVKNIYDSSDDEDKTPKVAKHINSGVTRPSVAIAKNKRKRDQLATIKENAHSSPSEPSRSSPKKVYNASPKRKRDDRHMEYDSDMETKTSMSSTKRKRVRFTEEEKKALWEGVEEFGVGNWSEILSNYDEVFRKNNRTNVNLKDLYRTLTKQAKP
jgi:hypothetical protein